MDWVISGLCGGAVFAAMVGLRPSPAGRWALLESTASPPGRSPGDRPGRLLLARLGRLGVARRLGREQEIRRRLQLAGEYSALEAFRGTQVACCCALLVPIVLVGVSFVPSLALAPVATLAGLRVPEIVLAKRARRRQERIAAAVPDLVELLLAITDAGLGPPIALRRTAEVLRGPLGEEIRVAVHEVELGVPWHRAVHGVVVRTNVPALRALEVALARSNRLGSALGTTLRRLAEDLRRERRARAEEAARKAPIKMLFPLVFLILPAFLLLTVGPVVLATIRSLR